MPLMADWVLSSNGPNALKAEVTEALQTEYCHFKRIFAKSANTWIECDFTLSKSDYKSMDLDCSEGKFPEMWEQFISLLKSVSASYTDYHTPSVRKSLGISTRVVQSFVKETQWQWYLLTSPQDVSLTEMQRGNMRNDQGCTKLTWSTTILIRFGYTE